MKLDLGVRVTFEHPFWGEIGSNVGAALRSRLSAVLWVHLSSGLRDRMSQRSWGDRRGVVMKLDLGDPAPVWESLGGSLWGDLDDSLNGSLGGHLEGCTFNRCWRAIREGVGLSVRLALGVVLGESLIDE